MDMTKAVRIVVFSFAVWLYVIPNPDSDQSDIAVNYTVSGEHILGRGVAARMIQRYDNTPDDLTDADYSYSLITIGEGDAALQGGFEWFANYMANQAWSENAYDIFDTANDLLL